MANTEGGFDWGGLVNQALSGAIDVAKAKAIDQETYDRTLYGAEDYGGYGYNSYGANNRYGLPVGGGGGGINPMTVVMLAGVALVAVFVIKKAL